MRKKRLDFLLTTTLIFKKNVFLRQNVNVRTLKKIKNCKN